MGVPQIQPVELAARLRAGEAIYLVDVREPWEHALCALPGSLLVPLAELDTRADEIVPPDGALVVAYCHHGVRSLGGAAMLERLGHAGAASLAGGIDRWSIEVDPSLPRY